MSQLRPFPSLRFQRLIAMALCACAAACGGASEQAAPEDPAARSGKPAQPPTPRATTQAGPEAGGAPPAADALGFFVERAAELGLDFVHVNGMIGELYFHEMMGSGAAWIDYDRDGDLDLYVVQGHPLDGSPSEISDRLYRNDLEGADAESDADGPASWRFVDVTEEAGIRATGYGMGVAVGDYDGDGWPDLYITNYGANQLWRNRGDGTFVDVTREAGVGDRRWSVPASFFDYDADGDLDLFVGNYVDFTVAAHKRCTTELGEANYCGPLAYRPQPDALYENRGDGTFREISAAALRSGGEARLGGALGAISGDFDGDGKLDLYVGNDGLPNHLWINRGDGSFSDEALFAGAAVNAEGAPEASMGIDAVDIDYDGDEDLFITHLRRETHTLYLAQGGGLFSDASAKSGLGAPSWEATGFGAGWLDFDLDGRVDLITANGAVRVLEELLRAGDPFPLHQPNQLFQGTGKGFREVSAEGGGAFALSEVSRGVAVGDADNDGDADVLVTQNNGPLRLLVNRVGQDRSWLGLEATTAAGAPALGAWIELRGSGGSVWRRVRTDGSYASARDPRLRLALAEAPGEGPYEATVLWSDGSRERFTDLVSGTYNRLTQGQGRSAPRGVSR